MNDLVIFPLIVFSCSFVGLWFSALVGAFFHKRMRPLEEDLREDFGIIRAASLTLLSLIIGFTFSMAGSRYDQRKNSEEAEANAIGTEYVRADLLPAADATKVRELLKNYLDQRVLFYTSCDSQQLRRIDSDTTRLQNDLWSVVQAHAGVQPTSTVALTVAGMNDVLNSEGYTQAAWWNHIPVAAWLLMTAIAIYCNLLIGYSAQRSNKRLFLILPLAVSVSFFLIADIDSPRGGLIRVQPQNLVRLAGALRAR
jgi:hypothetical protein